MSHIDDGRTLVPLFLRVCAGIAALGVLAGVVSTLWAAASVPDYNWITDTISDMAAGENEIIADVGLYLFAAGVFSTALAGAHFHADGRIWGVGVLFWAAIAAMIVIIAARNEYGDGDSDGMVVHAYIVYGLGAAVPVAGGCMVRGLSRLSRRLAVALAVCAVLWIVAGALFYMVPTDIDGLVERIAGGALLAAVAICAVYFWRTARDIVDGG